MKKLSSQQARELGRCGFEWDDVFDVCQRPAGHPGEHCGTHSRCDYDEHDDPCACAVPALDHGRRCRCGGWPQCFVSVASAAP